MEAPKALQIELAGNQVIPHMGRQPKEVKSVS